MKKAALAIILLSALSISSCKKDSKDEDTPSGGTPAPSGKCLTTALKSGSIPYFTWGYDANRNLSLMVTYDDQSGKQMSSIAYLYDGGKLNKETKTEFESDGVTISDV